jgi:hypothetical protein
MQRYNPFTLIHKALRAMLYDTALTIQQTCFADTEQAEIALEKVETVIYNFEKHALHEDTHVLPAIHAFQPELQSRFEEEHEEDELLGNRLTTLVLMYRSLLTTEERVACGSALSRAFVEFLAFNLEHMAKEEALIAPVLWANYTDEELLCINQKIVASIPPQEMMVSATWMMRGINNSDAINWLTAVKKSAPDFVFQSLLTLAEAEFTTERLTTIVDKVLERELVS